MDMNFQQTNQTLIDAMASDNAWAVVENMAKGPMTPQEAVEAQVEGAMQDPYDEDLFDGPIDSKQEFLNPYKLLNDV